MFRIALSALLLAPTPALACAGFFHEDGALAESSYEEAIFQKGDGWVEVQYKVNLEVDASDFGWIIPIPGEFQSFGDGDSALFTNLFNTTAPELDLEEVESGGGCLDASKGGVLTDSANSTAGGITVVYQGSTPSYDYSVLAADSSDAMLAWLTENGWNPGESSAALEDYVNEGGYQFVAVKTHIDPVTETVQTTLPPAKIRYSGDQIRYPARMGRYAQAEVLSSIVYVLGDQRARISGGWDQVEVPEIADEGEDPDYVHYTMYPETIAGIGRDGGYALTYAGAYKDGWVTRFETTAPREINSVDVEFAVDEGTDSPLHLVLSNTAPAGCTTSGGARGLGMLALLGLLHRRRRSA